MSGLLLFQFLVVLIMVIFAAIGLNGYRKYKDEDEE